MAPPQPQATPGPAEVIRPTSPLSPPVGDLPASLDPVCARLAARLVPCQVLQSDRPEVRTLSPPKLLRCNFREPCYSARRFTVVEP